MSNLVNELNQASARWFGRVEALSHVFRRMRRNGDPSVIPWLIPYANDRHVEVSEQAQETIEKLTPLAFEHPQPALLQVCLYVGLVEKQGCQDAALTIVARLLEAWMASARLIDLDRACRTTSDYGAPGWENLAPHLDSPNGWTLLAVALMHRNGRVRAKALDRLLSKPDPRVLPFILIRTADWVDAVRFKAHEAYRIHIAMVEAREAVGLLPIVHRLHLGKRDRPDAVIRDYEQRIASLDELLSGTDVSQRPLDAAKFSIAYRNGVGDRRELIRQAARARAVAVRILACRWIAEQNLRVELGDAVNRLLRDRSDRVRKEALRMLLTADPAAYRSAILDSLLDFAHQNQDFAIRYLQKNEGLDLQAYYGQQLEQTRRFKNLAAAVRGFSLVANAADSDRIRPYLTHNSKWVRREALLAFKRWDVADLESIIEDALAREDGKVAKIVVSIYFGKRYVPSASLLSSLQTIARQSESWSRFQLICRLTRRLSKWRRLAFLLRAAIPDSGYPGRLIDSEMRLWLRQFNTSFAAPTLDELAECLTGFDAARPHIDTYFQIEIAHILGKVET